MPLRSTSVFSRSARRHIELALHQPVHQVQQRHRRAGFGKAIGRLESEQAAADHDDALLRRSERQQQIDVAGIAKGVHAGEIGARHVEPQRRRAGGEHELGIFDALFTFDLESRRPVSISVTR